VNARAAGRSTPASAVFLPANVGERLTHPCACGPIRATLGSPLGRSSQLVTGLFVFNAAARLWPAAFPSLGSCGYCNEGHRRTRRNLEITGHSIAWSSAPHSDPRPCWAAENARLSAKATPSTSSEGDASCGGTERGFRPPYRRIVFTNRSTIARRLAYRAGRLRRPLGAAIRPAALAITLQTLPENDFPELAAGDMTHSFNPCAAD